MLSFHGGGAEKVFINLANYLSEKGHAVDVVVLQKEGPYVNLVSPQVSIVDFKAKRLVASLFPLISYLRERKPHVLISTLDDANIIAIIARFLSLSRAKSVLRVANTFSLLMQEIKPVKRFFLACAVKLLYPFADAIVAISQGVADDLSKNFAIPRGKIKVIYNPIHIHEVFEKSKDMPDHPWLRDKKIPVILNVGRLKAQKDQLILIEAFSYLRRKRKVRLIILGEGPDREKLEQLSSTLGVANDVSFPGFVQNPYANLIMLDD